ncbi:MAG TPA: hypothetical protein VGP47_02710 [Parachlamydiaceae bacterium]|nr:hypothetical protein [Parachlamydiaceae bacterium]
MINILGNNTTSSFMPPAFDFNTPETSLSCLAMKEIMLQTKIASLTYPLLKCNEQLCLLSLEDKDVSFSLRDLDNNGCSFTLVSGAASEEEVALIVNVQDGQHTLIATSDDKILTTTTDFQNIFRSQWGQSSNADSKGEFSLTIDPNSPENVAIRFKNGDSELVGNCQIGSNQVSCVLSKGWLASLFQTVNVEMSKKEDTNGVVHYSFDISANSVLPFTTPKNLGHFEYHLDSRNLQVKAEGQVKIIDGTTLFSGNLECSNPERCDAQAKLSFVDGSGSLFENELDYQQGPTNLKLSIAEKATYDDILKSFGIISSETRHNINLEHEVQKDGSYQLSGESTSSFKSNDQLDSEFLAKMELDIQENRQMIKGSIKNSNYQTGVVDNAQAEASHRIKGNNEIYEVEFEGADGTEFSSKYSTPRK